MTQSEGIGKITNNPFMKNSKALISKVAATEDLKTSILKAVNVIGGFKKIIDDGDRVLLKHNFNSYDPPPASSDPKFLKR